MNCDGQIGLVALVGCVAHDDGVMVPAFADRQHFYFLLIAMTGVE